MSNRTRSIDDRQSFGRVSSIRKITAFLFIKFFRFFTKKRLSYDTIISYGGFIVSIAVLTAALSLLFGYQETLKEGLLGANGHVYGYSSTSRYLSLQDISNIEEFLSNQKQVSAFSPVTITQAMAAKYDNKNDRSSVDHSILTGVVLRSIDWSKPNLPTAYHDLVVKGTSELHDHSSIVIGEKLAEYMRVGIGDRIKINSPANTRYTLFGLRSGELTVTIVGIYRSGIYETDSKTIFVNSGLLSDLLGDEGYRYNLFEVALHDQYIEKAHVISREWNNKLRHYYQFDSWIDYNGNLFAMLVVQRWVIFIILSFIILIASFGIASNTAKTVMERKKEVGILRAIGADSLMIKAYFMGETILLGLISIVIGILLGIITSWLLTQQTLFMLQGDVYFIERFTTHISVPNLLLTIVVSLFIAVFASFAALKRVSRLTVIEAITRV